MLTCTYELRVCYGDVSIKAEQVGILPHHIGDGEMTYDKRVLLNAGPELDRLVATDVMGWFEHEGKWWKDHEGTYAGYDVDEWHPSGDLNMAGVVLEKFKHEPWAWNIESENVANGKSYWWVLLWRDDGAGSIIDFDASAKELPLAICQAALLAVAENK